MPETHLPSKADIMRLQASIDGPGGLTEQIIVLAQRDEDKGKILRNTRIALALVVVIIIAGGFTTWYFVHELHSNSVTQCENSNLRTDAQKGLWDGLVLNSKANSPEEAKALKAISDYVDKVYARRDCGNLGQQFVPPGDFPDLGLN